MDWYGLDILFGGCKIVGGLLYINNFVKRIVFREVNCELGYYV